MSQNDMQAGEIIASSNLDLTENGEIIPLVTFRLGGEEFGVDIFLVTEIIRLVPITQVPHAPKFVEGVINLRGSVLPVIGLRKRFNLPEIPWDEHTRIIVMRWNSGMVGFLVDAVSEVLRIPSNLVEEPPSVVGGVGAEYIVGVGKLGDRLLVLLNMEKLINNVDVIES